MLCVGAAPDQTSTPGTEPSTEHDWSQIITDGRLEQSQLRASVLGSRKDKSTTQASVVPPRDGAKKTEGRKE